MKLTKSRLQQIIKEELKSVFEGDDWYDDEHETRADRKFADRPSDRPFRTGVPEEDVLKHGADLEKYPTTPEELESDRIAQELEDAWVDAGNSRKRLANVDNEILDMAMAVRDGDMDMEDALDQVRSLREAQKGGAKGIKYPKLAKDARKDEKEAAKRKDRKQAKQDLKET